VDSRYCIRRQRSCARAMRRHTLFTAGRQCVVGIAAIGVLTSAVHSASAQARPGADAISQLGGYRLADSAALGGERPGTVFHYVNTGQRRITMVVERSAGGGVPIPEGTAALARAHDFVAQFRSRARSYPVTAYRIAFITPDSALYGGTSRPGATVGVVTRRGQRVSLILWSCYLLPSQSVTFLSEQVISSVPATNVLAVQRHLVSALYRD
jgi:hypothetical protein